jgi:hypothetical protein
LKLPPHWDNNLSENVETIDPALPAFR